MRFGWLVAAAAMVTAGQASAATIVQTTSNSPAGPIGQVSAFDQSLGTLLKVTLETFARENRVIDYLFALPPPNGATYNNVGYNLQGQVIVSLSDAEVGGNRAEIGRTNIAGADYRSLAPFAGTQTARLIFWGVGSAVFDLAPSLFTVTNPYLYLQNNDPGFRDGSSDTRFFADTDFDLRRYPSQCGETQRFGDEACNNVSYRLTYEYARIGEAVPEPTSWAMMIFGLGGVGAAMRRRKVSARGSSVWSLSQL